MQPTGLLLVNACKAAQLLVNAARGKVP